MSFERKHLQPIPIAASACPYVRLMHTAADNFQRAEPVLGTALDEHGNALPWPQTQARLKTTLESFDTTIQISESHFPPPIQRQLETTLREVRAGRVQVAVARDGSDVWTRTEPMLERGKLAFGYASDLVGKQCGVMLGADDSTWLFPFNTTTTAAP